VRKHFLAGDIANDIEHYCPTPAPAPVVPTGVNDALTVISDMIDR
jgi:hypothetical protein